MKTELLALIDDLVKSELYVTEGKLSAAKDAKRIRADIVFLLDKAEQEEAAIGAGGVERLRGIPTTPAEPLLTNMDRGVLRMPMDLAMDGEISRRQFYQRVQSLLDRIDALPEPTSGNWMRANDVDRLTHELDSLLHGHADAANNASLCDLVSVVKCAVEKRGTPLLAAPADALDALTQAARDVLAERQRQITVKGWTSDRDDRYDMGELTSAAGCYAMYTLAYPAGDPHTSWPWRKDWWKPSAVPRRNLEKAGALILAEIERIDRAAIAAQAAQKEKE